MYKLSPSSPNQVMIFAMLGAMRIINCFSRNDPCPVRFQPRQISKAAVRDLNTRLRLLKENRLSRSEKIMLGVTQSLLTSKAVGSNGNLYEALENAIRLAIRNSKNPDTAAYSLLRDTHEYKELIGLPLQTIIKLVTNSFYNQINDFRAC